MKNTSRKKLGGCSSSSSSSRSSSSSGSTSSRKKRLERCLERRLERLKESPEDSRLEGKVKRILRRIEREEKRILKSIEREERREERRRRNTQNVYVPTLVPIPVDTPGPTPVDTSGSMIEPPSTDKFNVEGVKIERSYWEKLWGSRQLYLYDCLVDFNGKTKNVKFFLEKPSIEGSISYRIINENLWSEHGNSSNYEEYYPTLIDNNRHNLYVFDFSSAKEDESRENYQKLTLTFGNTVCSKIIPNSGVKFCIRS
jgi:hypothetical protein